MRHAVPQRLVQASARGRLAQASTGTVTPGRGDSCRSAPAAPPLPEAPASVNVHLTIHGRQVQLTLRDTGEGRLLVRLDAVL